MNQPGHQLADRLTSIGAIRDPLLARAFAEVPRHVFLPADARALGRPPGMTAGQWRALDPVDVAYHDLTMVTDADESGKPVSSSTAPSVMGFMLEALDLRPGHRVLEIGCGTGYNAAIIRHVTGRDVVSVDPFAPAVTRARSALADANVTGVTCVEADGFEGWAADGPYDRVIVTCSVAGVAPSWLAQMATGGRIVLPLAHGGVDPLVMVQSGESGLVVRPIGGVGYFIRAQGPLFPAADQPSSESWSAPTIRRAASVPSYRDGYHDLWFHAAVTDRRVTAVGMDGVPGTAGFCGLADGESAAVIQTTGEIFATGPRANEFAAAGANLISRWDVAGRPKARRWQGALGQPSSASDALCRPKSWTLETPGGGSNVPE